MITVCYNPGKCSPECPQAFLATQTKIFTVRGVVSLAHIHLTAHLQVALKPNKRGEKKIANLIIAARESHVSW